VQTKNETRVAIVTGGASGIGGAISRRLTEDGTAVAVFDLDGAAARRTASAIEDAGGLAAAFAVDVTDRAALEQAVDSVRSKLGRPVILVNSAGLAPFDDFLDISLELWERTLSVNLTGTFNCCQAVLPDMLDAGWGRIVNISSSSVHRGVPRQVHYVAAKSGVVGLTKSLALEFAPRGVTVNTIPPGFIDTPMLRKAAAEASLDLDRSLAATPVGRMGRPEDIAAACAFLVSDEAGYITGQIIGVNGGRFT
jgi:NAD(P)-dependent dehydrogenase (short-subunit alcohol dehydrogenase family)